MSSMRAPKSGLSRDTHQKIMNKYDQDDGSLCLEWLREIILENLYNGEYFEEIDLNGEAESFYRQLKDGYVLARLAKALLPNSVPDSKLRQRPTLHFKQMELIEYFLIAARDFGVSDQEVFQTCDLYERQNLHQVVVCLMALARKCKDRGMTGFGPRESQANVRRFSQEQLNAGKGFVSLQMGSNAGANQSGLSFGKTRGIVD
ncbi:myophilin-like [Tubulanus polymorphus]|uniref:myophilin-like n=1 Tax=Tubulanus polymorphus TaxID=672921 RepID=UPI003DA2D11B